MELQIKSPFEVIIRHTLNGGYVASVGCAKFAYANATALCRDLKAYLEDPQKYEKKYKELTELAKPRTMPAGTGPKTAPETTDQQRPGEEVEEAAE